jgi:hypothetical protein
MLGLMLAPFLAGDVPRFNGGLTAASLASGACSGGTLASTAQVRLTCDVINPNASYSLKYYKDGVLLATVASTQETHDYTVTGYKEGAGSGSFTSAYVFRVDLVDQAGVVIDSKTATTWAQLYSQCPAPVVSGVSATNLATGGCIGGNLTNDTFRVSWSMANPDNTNFRTVVKRNGSIVNADVNNATLFADHAPGGSENANGGFTNRSYTFTVEVWRRSNNEVVSTASVGPTNYFMGTTCGGGV